MKNRFHVCATCIHFSADKRQNGMLYRCQRLGYETKPNYSFSCWTPKEHVKKLMAKEKGGIELSSIIEASQLKKWMEEKAEKLTIIDCRFDLSDPTWGEQEYKNSHIPGAIYAHLERDLSGKVGEHGGRHPLPDDQEFETFIQKCGITKDRLVVAYDQGGAPFSSRLWWMLKYAGIEKVFVLNGGFESWMKEKYPISTEEPKINPSSFQLERNERLIAHYQDVKEVVEKGKEDVILIDSREEKRYKGEFEPIDHKAGHIPGAVNYPWMKGLEEKQFAPIEKQKSRFSSLNPNKEIIVYCGSGVTAAPNVLLLNEAGFKNVKLYVGSFSDWISYKESKIETN